DRRLPGSTIGLYDTALHQKSIEEYNFLHDFQKSLETGEICFWLQPQYRVSNRKIVGAEALARWQKPDGAFISPALFVPILEKHGLVTKLDTFIWESVCKWLSGWLKRGRPLIPISVNLSRIDIISMDVPEFFDSLLKKYDLPIQSIKVEITESAYVDNYYSVGETVAKLRERGFMVLMDDFGSGYSSLNMLHSLNLDLIKLDAQFLHIDDESEKKGVSILESIINMTRNLSVPIIVEGVETDDQVRFLSDLGCRYAQGFFFSRPLSIEQFEKLLKDDTGIDTNGFVFKANQQIQTHEFLDESVYSEVMLNNILGPVAFYNWSGDDVDIIRYNEQFFEMTGIELDDFNKLRYHMQDTIYPKDRNKLYELLEGAVKHHAIGSRGVLRVYRPNGMLVWISLKIFFLNENAQGKKFYASAQDVTELQFVSSKLPGAYYRCAVDDDFSFQYISQNFQELTGYNEEDIRVLFDNKLIRMVHPDDTDRLINEAHEVLQGERNDFRPYRLRRKQGDYIYVAEQSHLTDHYGSPCWQSMTIDVTDVMQMRNQMRILSKYLRDTVLFLHRTPAGLQYEVVIHGLGEELDMNAKELELALNSGSLCKKIQGYKNMPHREYTELFVSELEAGQKEITFNLDDGSHTHLVVKTDKVKDSGNDVEYIMTLLLKE
ncbi:MAG: EAL domain-containing protein, partial [Lachnospiraceae bacterium]|nr:EAL domain-containing protein [Lachnospiraceae bacterium]